MTRVWAAVVAIGIATFLGGCGTRVKTQVEAFAAHDAPHSGESVFVFAGVKPGTESLETQTWVDLTQDKFREQGFNLASNSDNADLLAAVSLGIDTGHDVTETFNIPQFGITGYSGASTVGSVQSFGNAAMFQTNTSFTPQYGITGFSPGSSTNHVFDRIGTLTVYRPISGGKPVQVFSATVTSSGRCGLLSVMSPILVAAIFDKFPEGGAGTSTQRVHTTC